LRWNIVEQILELGIQICEGLHAAHEKGITHRDIKPSNILIDLHGRAKIVDFGLASVVGTDQITKTGSTLGTIGYMSPEQIQGEGVDQRSDLFSFGVVLYELTTGHTPFKGETEATTLNSVLNDTPEPLSRFKSGVSDDLQRIVTKLLEKDPSLRYQSAAGVVSDLKRLRRDSDSSIITHTSKTQIRKTTRYLIPSLIVVLIVAALVFKPWVFQKGASSDAMADSNRLAIMYFDNLADPADSQKMGEIATNLLITDLSESRYVQVVSSQRLYDILKNLGREGEKKIDHTVASQIAEKAKAKWMLQGSILKTAPEIVMTAHLVEVSSGNTVASQRISGEPGEDIFVLVDKLTVEIKRDLSLPEEAMAEPDRPVAEVTTHSPEAYRYYLEGVDAGFKHYYAEAEHALKKAIELDSTFAMAYYRLAGLTDWGTDRRENTAKALRFSENASHREKLTIEGYHAFVNADHVTAIAKGKEIIKRYPDDKEMYHNIGYMYRYGVRQADSAIYYYTKAIELDPLYEHAYNQLAYAYRDIDDFEKSIWAINKYIELAPDQADEAIASFRKAVEIKPDFYLSWRSLGHMYVFQLRYDEARKCYEKYLESPRKSARSDGRLDLAFIPMHQGNFDEALGILDQGIAADRLEKAACWEKHLTIATIQAELGVVDKALTATQQAMDDFAEKRSPVAPFRHLYIRMLAENGRMTEAEEMLSAWKGAIEKYDTTFMGFYWIGAGGVERANWTAILRMALHPV
jgi:serine/threonine protein kinase/Tfp pilus assembly protein PilF